MLSCLNINILKRGSDNLFNMEIQFYGHCENYQLPAKITSNAGV